MRRVIWFRDALLAGASLALLAAQPAQGQPAQAPGAAANPLLDPDAAANRHFHPEGKPPSAATLAVRAQLAAALPFSDTRDLAEARRGFIAPLPANTVMADAGHIAWDLDSYKWLLQDHDFTSINPSLLRMARLNMNAGLYEVLPGKIYQVRGLDLTNITFVKGATGWIVFDPLTTQEVARFALKFINDRLGRRPVVAVVYSHSHIDHFGGVRGVASEADVRAGRTRIIAPDNFLREAISENVFAGNAMSRRSRIQYATILRRSPFGHVDQSLGKNVSAGMPTLIAPTTSIKADLEALTIDGVKMVFQNTPDTEAPVQMHTWFPEWKAFWSAENVTGTIHNVYTLRGAPVRNSMEWSKQINLAMNLFPDMEVMFASHHWPRWGNARAMEVLRAQRDLYANMHSQVLHLANQGVTINQVHNVYRVPKSLEQQWAARSYHGALGNNVRAIVNRYLGYWDGNPANLEPPSPTAIGPLFVEMMGGADPILAKGRTLNGNGQYREAAQILQHLVYAQPTNQAGRNLLADAFEQLGYQSESTSFRNSYLQLAAELRSGIADVAVANSSSPDIVSSMTTAQWLDFLGISMDSRKAESMAWTVNLVTPDNGERFKIEMSNATLHNIQGFTDPKAALTITVNRADLTQVMMGTNTFEELEQAGLARFEGDRRPFDELRSTLTVFTPDFEIFPGTRNARPVQTGAKPFQYVVDRLAISE
ncbi:alkyl/aryl-sulfatase [Polymorphobacter fuscus]|uniref:MBL fold metallo-hydrolase n=1 Tax=Sandarakinorhabdus fusca TaxID=1439888 RepID=A0A7C9GR56_9SPHN|nr:alkyl sulfatase dimerization domain-containing protein [Polymorphobacter fuscus]KAB7644356.1 MBL fold metallo-hydrolase [Polymorphobacter fuscus]MQT18273.1 MBL fold metallo-hydrolase [Polymorphobacter fuscus]NJC08167.1 alkyl sulfatase BDS1-like metallo-beta-lactamase superfamily hydrolase [Polymorphobacter fuscus]